MRIVLAAILSLGLVVLTTACRNSSSPAAGEGSAHPWETEIVIPYEKHVLPNGLTLIIHEDHKVPVVAVNIWYHVGSKDERPGRTGFAHLFEHLMFNGSENHNDEFFRPLRDVGATKMNGSTWLDRTNYYQNVPTSALDLTLWLESDRMGHLLGAIDQKKLDEQRGVVQNEKRQGQNRPYGKADEVIAANTYPVGHPYSWETIGSMEDLNAASLKDVKEWFRTHYGAANAVLVIAGDVKAEDVKKKVELYFGDIPAGPVLKRHQEWIAKMTGTKRATLQDYVPQARIIKTWNIPGYRTRDFSLLKVASQILGQGKNSRLYKRLVYTDQTATEVEAGIGPFEIGSQFQVTVTVKPGGDTAAVEKALDEEMDLLRRKRPTIEELDRIKTVNYASFVRGIERIDGSRGKSYILAESEVYGRSPDFYKQATKWMNEAKPEDVKSVAKEWLGDGVFVLEVTPAPEYRVAATGADRTKLPATSAPPALELPPLQRTVLANGLEVVLAERHNAPLVHVQLLIDAGYASDSVPLGGTVPTPSKPWTRAPSDAGSTDATSPSRSAGPSLSAPQRGDDVKPGLARVTLAMLDEGTKTRDALQIAEQAELLGAQLQTASTLDSSSLTLSAIKSKLSESLELFSDIVLNATFPEAELERQRAQTLAGIKQEKAQPRGIVARVFPQLAYGEGHAYAGASSGLGTEAGIKALTREDLQSFTHQWVRPDNATLLIVGDTSLAEIKPLLEQRFATWKAPAEPLPTKNLTAVALQPKPRVFLVNRPGAEQSTIVAGYPGPVRYDPDYVALSTFNTILGAGFISRINMNLREDKGWAYGARSSLVDAEGPGLFTASASVQTDKTAESMHEIVKELRDILATRKPTDKELQFARNSLVLGLPGSNETASEVANSYASILTFGLPDDYWNAYVREVDSVTPGHLQAAGEKLVRPDALTWLVVGDLSHIEAPIRKLNLGSVTVLDTDGNVLR